MLNKKGIVGDMLAWWIIGIVLTSLILLGLFVTLSETGKNILEQFAAWVKFR